MHEDITADLRELIVRYFDDALDDVEMKQLEGVLESSPASREIFNEMVLQSQIVAESQPTSLTDTQAATVMPNTIASWSRRIVWGMAGVTALLLCMFLLRSDASSDRRVVATLSVISGVAGPEGNVTNGATLYTRGAGSSARLKYPDGTVILMDNETRLVVDGKGGKDLQLLSGSVTASVAPQPRGKPLRITTEHAVAEVLGTELSLGAEPESTALSVIDGTVRLQRLSDGQSIDVRGGHFAVADRQRRDAFAVQSSPEIPSEFQLSFDRELPSGWQAGALLPPRGKGEVPTVRSEPVTGQPRGTHFQIYTHNAQYEGLPGLFRIHDDTQLHLRYRMQEPGWFQIFVGVRPDKSEDGPRANFMLSHGNGNLKPGQWRTIHVPFKKLRNLQGKFSATGHHCYFVLLDTQVEDRGLELQRLWVTRADAADDAIVIEDEVEVSNAN